VDALNSANLDRFPSFKELLINAFFDELRRRTQWGSPAGGR
jgi:hypothetical protein